MSIFKKKNKNLDICPYCIDVIEVYHSNHDYQFECPNCHQTVFWDSKLKILKKEIFPDFQYKDDSIRMPTKKEWLYIFYCIAFIFLYILVFTIQHKIYNHNINNLIEKLTLCENRTLEYINNSEFTEAELEINKMTNIYNDLPTHLQEGWIADQNSLLRIIKEKNPNYITETEEPEKEKHFWIF